MIPNKFEAFQSNNEKICNFFREIIYPISSLNQDIVIAGIPKSKGILSVGKMKLIPLFSRNEEIYKENKKLIDSKLEAKNRISKVFEIKRKSHQIIRKLNSNITSSLSIPGTPLRSKGQIMQNEPIHKSFKTYNASSEFSSSNTLIPLSISLKYPNFKINCNLPQKFQTSTASTESSRNPQSRSTHEIIQNKKFRAKIKAEAFAVYQVEECRFLTMKNGRKKREIASLTKIATCMTCLSLADKFKVDVSLTKVKISKIASNTIGTTASLIAGHSIRIIDLLYGLMLPSGNDAAIALAEYFGKFLCERKGNLEFKKSKAMQRRMRIAYFVAEMNNLSKFLGLKETNFTNPHGLQDYMNYSCCVDLSILASYCLQSNNFREIVGTKFYNAIAYCKGEEFKYNWENTNKLLGNGFYGVKTGMTNSAGSCLAAAFKTTNFDSLIKVTQENIQSPSKNYIIIVLGCLDLEERFKATKILMKKVNSLTK